MKLMSPSDVNQRLMKRLVYWRALPEWTYPTMHRIPTFRRALHLQPGLGPKGARFLEECRRDGDPPVGEFVEVQGRPQVPFGRVPLVARGAHVAPVLTWDELEDILAHEPVISRDGVQNEQQTFKEWLGQGGKLVGRRLPDALAKRVDWSACPFLEEYAPSVWSQRPGHATQLHQDFSAAVELNLIGKKTWVLFPPCQEDNVYARMLYVSGFRGALVDPKSKTATRRFKRFARAIPPIEITTQPGDLLYVPAGWFHHVLYLERSFTINFFNLTEELRNCDVSRLRGVAHLLVVRGGGLASIATPV